MNTCSDCYYHADIIGTHLLMCLRYPHMKKYAPLTQPDNICGEWDVLGLHTEAGMHNITHNRAFVKDDNGKYRLQIDEISRK